MPVRSQAIGSIDGGWSILLKLLLACCPVFVALGSAWCGWASVSIAQNAYLGRTSAEAQLDIRDQLRGLTDKLDKMPPDEWKARVAALELDQKRIIEQTTRILVEVEYLKSELKRDAAASQPGK